MESGLRCNESKICIVTRLFGLKKYKLYTKIKSESKSSTIFPKSVILLIKQNSESKTNGLDD
jgi:diphthamide biosynthesis methyltransferase